MSGAPFTACRSIPRQVKHCVQLTWFFPYTDRPEAPDRGSILPFAVVCRASSSARMQILLKRSFAFPSRSSHH